MQHILSAKAIVKLAPTKTCALLPSSLKVDLTLAIRSIESWYQTLLQQTRYQGFYNVKTAVVHTWFLTFILLPTDANFCTTRTLRCRMPLFYTRSKCDTTYLSTSPQCYAT
ncbi:uncharacterized protein RCO7_14612 [Rhynchosporium graminicola]|uniref:Uncharacterized protein n=2 Tax=Rhynchosporium TaxID=38037 RepID=A0A1E1M3S1_RHYSE|nr:uncharacterized protein RCO7_14612 [Rhynchosporium commune]CZT43752.1 uncharacterized protein RSE6_03833 [Rhynchosporium secalis]